MAAWDWVRRRVKGLWRPLAVAIAVVAIGVATEAFSRVHLPTTTAIVGDAEVRSGATSLEAIRHEDRPDAVMLELTVVTPESFDGENDRADAGRELSGTYRFALPNESRLVGELAAGLEPHELDAFVARYLGAVAVRLGAEEVQESGEGARTLRPASSEMTRLTPQSPAQVRVTLEPVGLARVNQVLVRVPYEVVYAETSVPAPDTTVVVNAGEGGRVQSPYREHPDSLSPNGAVFVRRYAPPAPLRFELGVAFAGKQHTAGRMLGEHGGVRVPAPLDDLAIGLLEALPVVVALFAVSRAGAIGGFQPTARHLIAMTLAFHVAVYASAASEVAARRVADGLGPSWWRPEEVLPWALPSGAGGFGLLAVFGLVVWPVAAVRLHRRTARARAEGAPSRSRWLGRAAGGLTVAGLLAVGLLRRRDCRALVPEDWLGTWDEACAVLSARDGYLVTLGLAAVMVIGVAVLLRVVAGPGRTWASTGLALVGASVLVASALLVPALVRYASDWTVTVLRAVFLAFAGTTVAGFGWLFAQILKEQTAAHAEAGGDAPPSRGMWARWLVALGPAVVLGVLLGPTVVRVLERQRDVRISPWDLFSFAFALDWLLYLPPVLCVVLLLRQAPEPEEGGLGTDVLEVRRLGIAFLLLVAFSGLDRWFYLPLPLLLSWALVATVLLPRPSAGTKLPSDGAGLRALLEERRVTSRLRSLRQKHRSGEAVASYDAETSALEVARRRLRREAAEDGDPFLLAPEGSRWESGRRGAACALLLSLPSMALFLYQRLVAPARSGSYPLLPFVGEVPLQVFQWTAYGFFLGYFYTLLCGRTGMEKAARLFLVLLVHHAFAELLSGQPDWQDVVFWALQTFVLLVLVGLLVGDYNVARRAGLNWRDLVELHDVRWAAAWASSVAVAIGGVALTLVSTAASDLYKATQEKPPSVGQPPPPTALPRP